MFYTFKYLEYFVLSFVGYFKKVQVVWFKLLHIHIVIDVAFSSKRSPNIDAVMLFG